MNSIDPHRPSPRGGRRRLAALLIAAFLPLAAAAPAAAQYRLAGGDRIRVTVLGAVELSGETEVDIDGYVRLPVFGSVEAVGRDVAELEQALRDAVAGRVYKRVGADGAPIFASVEPDDVFASVALYRPVYVTGAVTRGGGAVVFRPGMTARAAIASVGGIGEQTTNEDIRRAAPRLRGEERTLAYEIGRLVAELWRLDAELAEIAEPEPPQDARVPLRTEVFDALLAAQRANLKTSVATTAERRAYFAAALEQVNQRIEILRAQRQNQVAAAEFDAEEQERVETLFQRGVVPVSRLLDTRRAQLLSSSRLLETDNNLERVLLEKVRIESDEKLYEEDRVRLIYDATTQARARLEAALARLAAVREELSVTGELVLELDGAQERTAILNVYRGAEILPDIGPELALEPGDIVEVVVELLDPTAEIR
ncbi:polysaccharide biosynthesis/export family protein [Rubrimonas sp.]|uniref:polysaccharide biosynthesis/export family protein n=1 Tax=Rubrimonas sp. TaxID=2036015 RepID=UPI002FDE5533